MIYFIRRDNSYIKIGRSVEPDKRRADLQTASPEKLHIQCVLSGDSKTEAGLHELFSHLRKRGEWFRYTDELKWYIRAVKENPDITSIKSLYMLSQQMRISAKAKRLGKGHSLSKKINKINGA